MHCKQALVGTARKSSSTQTWPALTMACGTMYCCDDACPMASRWCFRVERYPAVYLFCEPQQATPDVSRVERRQVLIEVQPRLDLRQQVDQLGSQRTDGFSEAAGQAR